MLVTLNIIAAYHEKIAQATEKKVVKILNYVANHPEEITCYHTSGMILHIHSDAYFLSVLGSNIRAGGYHYLSSPFTKPNPPPPPIPSPLNLPIHVECTTMNNFLESAMESELGALFFNCQCGATLIIYLEYIGHRQPPKPVITDSATRDVFVNNNILQRRSISRSRSIDMIFYWL